MALIVMAVYDTVENQRTELTRQTLDCLLRTVGLSKHRVVIVNNNSCDETVQLLEEYNDVFKVIHLHENIGTARAVNKGIALRKEGEHVIKMDNDCIVNYQNGWVDEMERAINYDPTIGIIGLKRKDLMESPERTDFYKSELKMLPHTPGHPWIIVEKVNHVMGTCQMFNSKLLDKIGYLYQPRLYGFDDSLAAVRCQVAGFYNCFLPHIDIDHIDPGTTPFQAWKEKVSGEDMAEFNRLKEGYQNGTIPIFHNAY